MTAKTIVRRENCHDQIASLSGMNPLLSRIYYSRGVRTPEDVNHDIKGLIPFEEMLNIDQAVLHLSEAIFAQKNILIIGDFDADGATSTCVAVTALQAFGAKNVDYLVPNRFEYGYGLTPEIVEVALSKKPDLIITVDNGIASIAGVASANKHGLQVIVTDHHLPGDELPDALAIVNPNQHGCPFQSKNIAGVGVIFYVMLALRSYLQKINYFDDNKIPLPKMTQFLDLVALGTVADVVPLDKNNRILVTQGIKRIRYGYARPGIYALLSVANRHYEKINAQDLGFALGPRLNAAGRLDDMSLGIECLLAKDNQHALTIATHLNDLNIERKRIENEMQVQAMTELNQIHLNEDQIPAGICVFDESWHQGVIGILASRVKEHYHRPVIAFAKMNDDEIKGSARSINGVHIRDVLDTIANQHPGLIIKFGGHAMAAGLSLAPDKFELFSTLFAKTIASRYQQEDFSPVLLSDGELQDHEMTLDTANMLAQAGPWGQHFPEPLFDGEFELLQQRIVGEKHLKCVVKSLNSNQCYDAIAFNIDPENWPNHQYEKVKIVYRLDINEFRGNVKVQFIIEHIVGMTADILEVE